MSRCPGNTRHWFTAYGCPGLRLPYCTRCKAPNPRKLTRDERMEFEYAVRQGWVKPPPQSCEHPEDKLEPEILNPDDENLRYCRACHQVVERINDHWVSFGPLIMKVSTR